MSKKHWVSVEEAFSLLLLTGPEETNQSVESVVSFKAVRSGRLGWGESKCNVSHAHASESICGRDK
jgi:hypothetical protein